MKSNPQTPAPNKKRQLLLELAAEGGSIKLMRMLNQDITTYQVSTGETYFEGEWYSSKEVFNTLDEAVQFLCNRYPVVELHPLTADHEIILPVAQAIKQKRLSGKKSYKTSEESLDQNQIEQLNKIEHQDWNELSAMLQELFKAENDLKGGKRKYENQIIDSILGRIQEQTYKMKIVYDFGWSHWDEGRWLASFPDFDWSLLSSVELSKLITAIARNARFRDYAWNDNFASGMMQKVIAALITKFQNPYPPQQIESLKIEPNPMKEIATKSSWQNHPIDNPKRIDIDLQFTAEQFSKLTYGLIPVEMEDKWFIFFENDWLYFHRSWTGFGFYKAQIIEQQEVYTINEFWAERNQEKYSNEDDKIDIEVFSFLIARGLLGIDVNQIYANQNIKSDSDAIKSWSMLGRMLFTMHKEDLAYKIKSVLFGVAVGDALGVPVEFECRQTISLNPVTDMIGYGTYNLPAGTWSDDSSLTFCLAEALTNGFDLNTIGQNFVNWYHQNYWTPGGDVFDIGIATSQAIDLLSTGIQPDLAGGTDESSNGNGSLMRISPLLFYLMNKPLNERFELTKQVSSLTHGHIRSVISCFYYLEFALQLLNGIDKFVAYKNLQTEITDHLTAISVNQSEITLFDRLLKQNIVELPEESIKSSGYVLHTLEASIWCLLTTKNYNDAVLKAVNLGEDTDTTGAVTGGLAGLLYGFENIPTNWLNQIARYDDIQNLAERLANKIVSHE